MAESLRVNARADRRGDGLATGKPVRVGGGVGCGPGGALSTEADIRRLETAGALLSIEDALILLDSGPSEAIATAALERIRDELAMVLRNAKGQVLR
jgi:hypothetical protein